MLRLEASLPLGPQDRKQSCLKRRSETWISYFSYKGCLKQGSPLPYEPGKEGIAHLTPRGTLKTEGAGGLRDSSDLQL